MRRAWAWVSERAAYLLALLPVLTDWLDTGHWPHHLHELSTEVVIGLLILAGVWTLYRRGDRFKQLAETDALTGLGNRFRFRLDLEAAVERARRARQPLALAFVDVDDFKQINDRFGHAKGDDVLEEVGRALRRSVREGVDGCYRIGGDEFAVIVSTMDAPSAVGALRRAFARASEQVGGLQLSLSVGVISLGDSDGPADFVQRADQLMYAAKRGASVRVPEGAAFGKVSSRKPGLHIAGAVAVALLSELALASPQAELPRPPEPTSEVAPSLVPRPPPPDSVEERFWVAPAPLPPKVVAPEGGVILFRFPFP